MSSEPPNSTTSSSSARPGRRWLFLAGLLAAVALVTIAVTALLITIFQHRQEARTPFVRVVEVDEGTSDPIPWSMNWPRQFDTYRRTVDTEQTTYGGSSAMPESKLEQQPCCAACTLATRSAWITARRADTLTCSTTRRSPNA